jgi:hypothetical protein
MATQPNRTEYDTTRIGAITEARTARRTASQAGEEFEEITADTLVGPHFVRTY